MIRSLVRRGLRIGVVVGAILFLVQIFLRSSTPPRTRSPQASTPGGQRPGGQPPAPTTSDAPSTTIPDAPTTTVTAAWVEPQDDGCPVTHPVKVKLASGIFHVPGGLAYDRTAPDRCYRDAAAAEADGFRPSKR